MFFKKKIAFSFQQENEAPSFVEVLRTSLSKKVINTSKQTVTELVNKSKSKISMTLNNYKSVVYIFVI